MKVSATLRALGSAAVGVLSTTAMGYMAGWTFDQLPRASGSADYTALCILTGFSSICTAVLFVLTFASPIMILALDAMHKLDAQP